MPKVENFASLVDRIKYDFDGKSHAVIEEIINALPKDKLVVNQGLKAFSDRSSVKESNGQYGSRHINLSWYRDIASEADSPELIIRICLTDFLDDIRMHLEVLECTHNTMDVKKAIENIDENYKTCKAATALTSKVLLECLNFPLHIKEEFFHAFSDEEIESFRSRLESLAEMRRDAAIAQVTYYNGKTTARTPQSLESHEEDFVIFLRHLGFSDAACADFTVKLMKNFGIHRTKGSVKVKIAKKFNSKEQKNTNIAGVNSSTAP